MTPLRRLPDGPAPSAPPPELAGAAHRSRGPAERLLSSADAAAAEELRDEYARQAAEWSAWADAQPDYLLPLRDALDRSGIRRPQLALEVGAGTGEATAVLVDWARRLLATDPVPEMAIRGRERVPGALWLRADARRLPVRDRALDALVCCNAVLNVGEAERTIRPGGSVLVVSSFGSITPIRHEPARLAEMMPRWAVDWAVAGHGDWVVLTRPEAG